MSRFTDEWEWLKSLGDALVSAGHFDKLITGKLPSQIPVHFKKVLYMRPVSHNDSESNTAFGNWEASFLIVILRNDFGGNLSVDPVTGTSGDLGYGALAELVRDNIDTNLKSRTCQYSMSEVDYLERDRHPQLGARFTLTINGVVSTGKRKGAGLGSVSVSPVTNVINDLDDVQASPSDGQALVYNSSTGLWEAGDAVGGASDHGDLTGLSDDDHTQYARADGSRTFDLGELEDVTDSASTEGELLVKGATNWENNADVKVSSSPAGVFLNVPVGTTADPTGVTDGDVWFYNNAGTVELRVRVGGVTKKVTFSNA